MGQITRDVKVQLISSCVVEIITRGFRGIYRLHNRADLPALRKIKRSMFSSAPPQWKLEFGVVSYVGDYDTPKYMYVCYDCFEHAVEDYEALSSSNFYIK